MLKEAFEAAYNMSQRALCGWDVGFQTEFAVEGSDGGQVNLDAFGGLQAPHNVLPDLLAGKGKEVDLGKLSKFPECHGL